MAPMTKNINITLLSVLALSISSGAYPSQKKPLPKSYSTIHTTPKSPEVPAQSFDFGASNAGEIGEAKYEYSIDALNDYVINGAIDGPATAPGYAMHDPDRWVVLFQRDKMTDAVSWYIHHYQTGLMLRMTRLGRISAICLVGSDFPGRSGAVRVGSAPAILVPTDCTTVGTAALQGNLMKGGRLLVRKYQWPYDYGQDGEGSADNFDKMILLFKYLVNRPKSK